jgi:hypothetical protein
MTMGSASEARSATVSIPELAGCSGLEFVVRSPLALFRWCNGCDRRGLASKAVVPQSGGFNGRSRDGLAPSIIEGRP